MSVQCRLCRKWYHYREDQLVCRSCYRMFKRLEIYGITNEIFEFGEEE